MELFNRFNKTKNERLLTYLQDRISDKSSLVSIVNVFEDMCRIPIEEDMILFETGTYSFAGAPMFYFSLVRQFPNCEEEYYQIHIDVLYVPEAANENFENTIWSEDIKENIFTCIKRSQEYEYCKDKEFCKVDIYMSEKYSLQGTTQGRYLTGGVPPVRFSM